MTFFLLCYCVVINFIAFFLMFWDKRCAIRHQWRISEKTLFLLAFLGGAAGAIAGMFLFHHKTRHLSFRVMLPLCLIVNVAVFCWLVTGELF